MKSRAMQAWGGGLSCPVQGGSADNPPQEQLMVATEAESLGPGKDQLQHFHTGMFPFQVPILNIAPNKSPCLATHNGRMIFFKQKRTLEDGYFPLLIFQKRRLCREVPGETE